MTTATVNPFPSTPMTYAYRAIVARRAVYKCSHDFRVKTALYDIAAQAELIAKCRKHVAVAVAAAEDADALASAVTIVGHGGKEWHDAARDADQIAGECLDKVEALEGMHAARKSTARKRKAA